MQPDLERGGLEQAASLRSVTQTVRVDIRKLDHLMNIVGELAIVRSAFGRVAEKLRGEGQRELAAELQRLHRNFDRHLGEMQDGILEVRMVPLGQVFDSLARVVRQISREVGKEIRLVITGAETEIDKLIVEELSDPLMHMIRNAIDHGIEAGQRPGRSRQAAGRHDRAERLSKGQSRHDRGRGRRPRHRPEPADREGHRARQAVALRSRGDEPRRGARADLPARVSRRAKPPTTSAAAASAWTSSRRTSPSWAA